MTIPPVPASRLSLDEIEADVTQRMNTLHHVSGDGAHAIFLKEVMISVERNRTRSIYSSASFTELLPTAGELRRSRSIGGRRMIGSYGRIYGVYTEMIYKGCGGEYWGSKS